MQFAPIQYKNQDPEADEARKVEEVEFFTLQLDCQILAEWFKALAENPPPWYPAQAQLLDWPIDERISELEGRPDLRLDYMLKGYAEGLPQKTTRAMSSADQASWLNKIRANGEKHAVDQIRMFDYASQMPHTDRATRFHQLVARIDWDDNSQPTKAFLAAVIKSCLEVERKYEDESGAIKFHMPPIDHLSLLRSIKAIDYVSLISREELAEIMTQRLEFLSRKKTFEAEDELRIVSVENLLKQLPTASFMKIFNTIREKLQFPESSESEEKPAEDKATDEAKAEETRTPAPDVFEVLATKGKGDSPKA